MKTGKRNIFAGLLIGSLAISVPCSAMGVQAAMPPLAEQASGVALEAKADTTTSHNTEDTAVDDDGDGPRWYKRSAPAEKTVLFGEALDMAGLAAAGMLEREGIVSFDGFVPVRESGEEEAAVVGWLFGKTKLTVLQETDEHMYVRTENLEGWVVSAAVEKVMPEQAEPAMAIVQDRELGDYSLNLEIRDDELVLTRGAGKLIPVTPEETRAGNTGKTALVSVNAVNVRKGPGLGEMVYTTAKEGSRFIISQDEGEWIKVYYTTEKEVWLHSSCVTIEDDTSFGITVSEQESRAETIRQMEDWICLGVFRLTAYCACARCCGVSDGITATGTRVRENYTVAVDRSVIPLGSLVRIDGRSPIYHAEDTGVKGKSVDVYFASHKEALIFGVQYRTVYIKRVG